MIDAWFSSSENTASSGVRMASNMPAFASKHDAYKMVSSRLWKSDNFLSNSCENANNYSFSVSCNDNSLNLNWVFTLCMVWVPQMNRTELNPDPNLSRICLLYSTTSLLFWNIQNDNHIDSYSIMCELNIFLLCERMIRLPTFPSNYLHKNWWHFLMILQHWWWLFAVTKWCAHFYMSQLHEYHWFVSVKSSENFVRPMMMTFALIEFATNSVLSPALQHTSKLN